MIRRGVVIVWEGRAWEGLGVDMVTDVFCGGKVKGEFVYLREGSLMGSKYTSTDIGRTLEVAFG